MTWGRELRITGRRGGILGIAARMVRVIAAAAAAALPRAARTGASIVRDAWQRGQELTMHGWIYGLQNGLLRDLEMTVGSADEIPRVYETALAAP